MTAAADVATVWAQAMLLEHDARIRADVAEEIAQAIEALRETDKAVRRAPGYALHMAAKTARELGAS